MKLHIAAASPVSDAGRAMIAGSQEALSSTYEPQEIFTLSPEELAADPATTFWIAHLGEPVGCVASVDYGDYVEVKRLFVTDAARGHGVARALMDRLEAAARAGGKAMVRLETGPRLVAAVTLYRALGYIETGPFGDYPEHPASLFMAKPL